MPTRKPENPIAERGVLLSDAAKDARIIEELTELLPKDLHLAVAAAIGYADPETIAEETEHAKFELVRYWISLRITALSVWEEPAEGLVLDRSTLMPDASVCPKRDEWLEVMNASGESLRAGIALDPDLGIPAALQPFTTNMNERLRKGAVLLPRGFYLSVSQPNRVSLSRARMVLEDL